VGVVGRRGWQLLTALIISGILLGAFVGGVLLTRMLALGEPLRAAARPESAHYVLILSSAVVSLLLLAQPVSRWRRCALLLVAGVLFAIFNAVDLTFLSYFNQPTVVLVPYLPRPEAHLATMGTLWTYVHQYVSPLFVLVTLAATLPAFAGLYWLVLQRPYRQIAAGLLVTGALSASQVLAARSTTRSGVTAPELEALKLDPHVDLKDLWRAERRGSFELVGAPRAKPRTIVMVVNESAGYVLPSSQDPTIRLVDRLLQHSGAAAAWQVYRNAVTNSNATDVSVPSILTGSATHEPIDKLHALPSVFDLAKARGYRTVYFTSSVMGWANLGIFLSSAPIDLLMDASTAGYPFLNDLATDDMAMMKDLRRFLLGVPADQDLFLYVYPNAMHTPYQHTGDIVFPDGMDDVVLRALFVLESEHKMLFDTLREIGRFDDALIVETGDHGCDPFNTSWDKMSRVENYEEPVLRPIFLIKPPADLPPEMSAALRINTSALVSNIDIAPTLADLLGIRLTGGLRYSGQSLFTPIPADRLAVATSTNDWRNWPNTAVALARGRQRFTCDGRHLCRLATVDRDTTEAEFLPKSDPRFAAFMREALDIPVVGANISRLYRDRMRELSAGGRMIVGAEALRTMLPERLGDEGEPVIHARAGHAPAYVLFGPYWPLKAGAYSGEMTVTVGPGGAPGELLCNLDVFNGEQVLGQQPVRVSDVQGAQRLAIPFEVTAEDGADAPTYKRYELRLWCTGTTDVTVGEVAFDR
jgi:hypothetical protein